MKQLQWSRCTVPCRVATMCSVCFFGFQGFTVLACVWGLCCLCVLVCACVCCVHVSVCECVCVSCVCGGGRDLPTVTHISYWAGSPPPVYAQQLCAEGSSSHQSTHSKYWGRGPLSRPKLCTTIIGGDPRPQSMHNNYWAHVRAQQLLDPLPQLGPPNLKSSNNYRPLPPVRQPVEAEWLNGFCFSVHPLSVAVSKFGRTFDTNPPHSVWELRFRGSSWLFAAEGPRMWPHPWRLSSGRSFTVRFWP
jgi:hypothetical protein